MIFRNSQYDPGLGTKLKGENSRIIDKRGNFNIHREGQGFSVRDVFQHLVNMSWTKFLIYLTIAFALINALFASLYVSVGIEGLQGAKTGPFMCEFKQAFFFSIQTCATVGYGYMAPITDACNYIASVETLFGLLCLSIATGLFYGRFSRPRSSIIFSNHGLISPFKNQTSFQFKIVNRRSDTLMDVEARTVLTMIDRSGGEPLRRYYQLPLEINQVAFMPLTWTLVHHINESSAMFDMSEADLKDAQAEILVQMKAFDETYNQVIYSRFSYPVSEWQWNAKFKASFASAEDGQTTVFVDKIHDWEFVS